VTAATHVRSTWLALTACTALALAAACGSDETQAAEDHTPVSYTIFVDGTQAVPPLSVNQDQTVRIRFEFQNAAGDDLDDIATTHFAGFTISPTAIATVTRIAGQNYQFDVTGAVPGSGTATVSFGHDEAADETSFTAFPFTVPGGGGGGN
jgi:hypothetical protein